MTSTPVYTSRAEGFRTAEEIAALRPIAEPKPRAPRKPAERRVVTSGIVCFCGERFAESQALEFMLHLRAEVGEVLEWKERFRQQRREIAHRYIAQPEKRARKQQRERERGYERRRDPVTGPRIREQMREANRRYREQHADDPEFLARRREQLARRRERERGRYQSDPEYREQKNAKAREKWKPTPEQKEKNALRARERRAERTAPCSAKACEICGKQFIPLQQNHATCSSECRDELRRKGGRERARRARAAKKAEEAS